MAITTRPIADKQFTDSRDIVKLIRDTFADLEDQLNARAQVYASTDGRIPAGLNRNDILIISFKGKITIQIKNKKGFDILTADMLGGLTKGNTRFLAFQKSNVAPALANFPLVNDWGFYQHTGTATYLCFNNNSVLKKVALT